MILILVIEAVAGAVSLYGSTPDGKHVAMLCKDAASIDLSATISASRASSFLLAMTSRVGASRSLSHVSAHTGGQYHD
jgi:hypothetical protein